MTAYRPLVDPDRSRVGVVPPVDRALAMAREVLAKTASTNRYDHAATLKAAVLLQAELARLAAAVETERDSQP